MNHTTPAKMTYTQGAENLVPDSAARWRSIRKNFIQSKASHQEKQSKIQKQNEITTHAYCRKEKRNANQSSQSHYYSHFNLKTKQTHANHAVRAAKRTGNALRQIYEAIIST